MKRVIIGAGLVVVASAFAACSNDSGTDPTAASEDDYALVVFGASGYALESSLGPQGGRPFDGRTGGFRLPPDLALTDEQRAEIAALREEFRIEHQETLDALRAIFEEARAAREAGATREEVRAILDDGRDIAQALRPDVEALHEAIFGVLTDEQQEWIETHRRGMGGRGPMGQRGPGRPGDR